MDTYHNVNETNHHAVLFCFWQHHCQANITQRGSYGRISFDKDLIYLGKSNNSSSKKNVSNMLHFKCLVHIEDAYLLS